MAPLYNPYGFHQAMQQPVNGLIRIDSIEGGQMYQLPPNSVSPPLFLSNEAAFLIKTTDGGGAATLKKYSFKEEPLEPSSKDYVTKADFDAFVQEIRGVIDGKSVVSKPTE